MRHDNIYKGVLGPAMIQEERGLLNGFVSKLSAICTSLFTFSTHAFYTDFTSTLWLYNDVH